MEALTAEFAEAAEVEVMSGISGLKLLHEPDQDKFMNDCRNDPDNMELAWINHHGQFAYYGTLVAKSSFQYSQYKDKLEKHEALLDAQYRNQILSEGGKPTEKAIDALIKSDKSWGRLATLVNTARMYADIHKTNLTALEHRKDMLMQMGAQMRKEMEGQLRLNIAAGTDADRTSMQEKIREKLSASS